MNNLMPALFVGHGSPMNAIQDNSFTKSLIRLGETLLLPKLILVISAHWMINETSLTSNEKLQQIYDFYGFPEELYKIKYSVNGNVIASHEISVANDDIPIGLRNDWGLDHGAWTVLKYLFPKANVPVVQLSLDYTKTENEHVEVAKKLNYLREQGVLIIGSGNIVHNLEMISWEQNDSPYDWTVDFDAEIKKRLLNNDLESLMDYKAINPEIAELAVPTNEHYLPMLYVAALKRTDEKINFFFEGFEHKSISMRSFIVM